MMELKVIVVRQPWAWLIVHGFKDIENRSWKTRYRGTLLIQASANLPARRRFEEEICNETSSPNLDWSIWT